MLIIKMESSVPELQEKLLAEEAKGCYESPNAILLTKTEDAILTTIVGNFSIPDLLMYHDTLIKAVEEVEKQIEAAIPDILGMLVADLASSDTVRRKARKNPFDDGPVDNSALLNSIFGKDTQ